jgi:biotin carboxyl carrier protein
VLLGSQVSPQSYAVQLHLESIHMTEEMPVRMTSGENLHGFQSFMGGNSHASPFRKATPLSESTQKMKKDRPICIVEAIKRMNEIQSDVSGIICKILVKNA